MRRRQVRGRGDARRSTARWRALTGRVLVNGEIWAQDSSASPLHDLGAAVAYAARGESLGPGKVLSSGTLPGCCGLEMRRSPSGRRGSPRARLGGIGKGLARQLHRRGRTVYATGL
ncbi:fumarylacetoacetate hydrolase family protein [Streptomyces canus]|uniref:fumarylacetoacetate hydrolase family protein n=1 Tax=Streptomyces canus TaxID=58343 RepID=UPI0033ADE5A7